MGGGGWTNGLGHSWPNIVVVTGEATGRRAEEREGGGEGESEREGGGGGLTGSIQRGRIVYVEKLSCNLRMHF